MIIFFVLIAIVLIAITHKECEFRISSRFPHLDRSHTGLFLRSVEELFVFSILTYLNGPSAKLRVVKGVDSI